MNKREYTEEETRRLCQFVSLLYEINKRVKTVPIPTKKKDTDLTIYLFGSPTVIPKKQLFFDDITYKDYTQYLF